MTQEEILRQLRREMELRGRRPETIKDYVERTKRYQEYYGKPASELGIDEMQGYLQYLLTEKKVGATSVNTHNSVLRFVYGVVLDVTLNYKKLTRAKHTRRLPQLFTREEIKAIIESAGSLCHKVMFMLAYGSGLRLSEITGLKVSDIESEQKRILVRHGKGDRDRYVLLPESTLEALREYWLNCSPRPHEWLFEAPHTGGRYHGRTLQDGFKSALKKSGVKKQGSMHTLRHCFATHFYEDGNSLLVMKKLMGHVRIDTTAWYTQLAVSDVLKLKSPIDLLAKPKESSSNG